MKSLEGMDSAMLHSIVLMQEGAEASSGQGHLHRTKLLN